jgi:hypothetical protein
LLLLAATLPLRETNLKKRPRVLSLLERENPKSRNSPRAFFPYGKQTLKERVGLSRVSFPYGKPTAVTELAATQNRASSRRGPGFSLEERQGCC